ncbi:MAG: hypothetical protein ACK4FK_06985 [Ferrovibrio sp.]|uniref:hypothetical protein n=1 Tax=Ferrovibrio sp. TaxID=1917215 RepID=UPI00391BB3F4
MKSFNHDTRAYAFLGLLVATVWAIPLAALLHRDAHGSPMDLPRCDEARSLDQVRGALEAQGGEAVLGLYAAAEAPGGVNDDYRRCTATVVTSVGEVHLRFTIGWHDRRNGIPFWTGHSL